MLEKDKKILEAWRERHQIKPIIGLTISWLIVLLWGLILCTFLYMYAAILDIEELDITIRLLANLHILIFMMFSINRIPKNLNDAFDETIIYYVKKKEGIL